MLIELPWVAGILLAARARGDLILRVQKIMQVSYKSRPLPWLILSSAECAGEARMNFFSAPRNPSAWQSEKKACSGRKGDSDMGRPLITSAKRGRGAK